VVPTRVKGGPVQIYGIHDGSVCFTMSGASGVFLIDSLTYGSDRDEKRECPTPR